ncbi:DtxR family transcriptional regulator, Mn-dependent transcriptional regulator/ferrous iron transport protein A [Marininema mesophilum]|uniref:DtxR family transcriptional regulator, Mn-dependent transcriptional regulator/ferrous iron transport protein A n=1 Tax=Marininema mesophilum TaxID=1048340 RepID=A0A1H2Q905_9BACL|nr:FeoA domain-containing protein [Marininema mesophilum]SDW02899.1 DtxR family transcriptional regulator, Mn-dependent transcriptional regulator/ferrous iron transport protein A [Marininema mesophilum]
MSECRVGTKGRIKNVQLKESYRNRVMDLGLTPGTEIEVVRKALLGDPIVIRFRGYQMGFRRSDVKGIQIETGN